MALIYKLTFPPNLFTTARDGESFSSNSSGGQITSYNTNEYNLSVGNVVIQVSDTRDIEFPRDYQIPNEDIASADFKVSTKLEENKSKITYRLSLVGSTAKLIIDFLKYIRFPSGSNDYPRPLEKAEYLFALDKQLSIEVTDDCCPVTVNGRGSNKLVIKGFIPLNTISYCGGEACSVDCTIFEDSKRTDAIKCIESTVLGVGSNVGKLVTSEIATDYVLDNTRSTTFATVKAKWFDSCIEPKSPGTSLLLLNFIGLIKTALLPPLIVVIATIATIATVVNVIIRAVNLIPGVNIPLISIGSDVTGTDPIATAIELLEELFGTEVIVENILGCRYIRGGFSVRSIISTVCSVCDFSTKKFRDGINFNTTNDDFAGIKVPVSSNPFISFGDVLDRKNRRERTDILAETSVYIPAEEAFSKKEERRLLRQIRRGDDDSKRSIRRRIAVKAASIETTDKVLNRLGSLWGTGWDVINCPVTEDTPNGIQLQLGPVDGRYGIRYDYMVGVNEPSSELSILDADVCYSISDNIPIGVQTSFSVDANDTAGNGALTQYRGYASFQSTSYKDRKPKEIADFPVKFAATKIIRSPKDDTLYDDLSTGRLLILGFVDLTDNFSEGTIVTSDTITTEPKLVTSKIESSSVLDSGIAARVSFQNLPYQGASRVSSVTAYDTNEFGGILSNYFPYYYATGIQSKNPFLTTAVNVKRYASGPISVLVEDYLQKFGSSEVGKDEAIVAIAGRECDVMLGPFDGLATGREVPADDKAFNFTPLMEFTLEKQNFTCRDEELINECITYGRERIENLPVQKHKEDSYKLRLLRLSQGVGVVTSLDIDYKNRVINAEGYVIPFYQAEKYLGPR